MRRARRFTFGYIIIAILIFLITACTVLGFYITSRKQYKSAALSVQTVNNLRAHGSMDMSAEIDCSIKGAVSNPLSFLGIDIGDIALEAKSNSSLSIQETQAPFAVHYEGNTGFTMFEQTIPLPLNGYVILEGSAAYNYTNIGNLWQKKNLDESIYTGGNFVENAGSMKNLDWYKTMFGLFYAVISESVTVDLEETQATMNSAECYVMHFKLSQEQLDSIIESTFPSDQDTDTLSYLSFAKADWSKIDPEITLYVSTEKKLPVRADINIGTVENIVLNKNISENEIMQLLGGVTVVIEDLRMSIDFNNYGTMQEITLPEDATAATAAAGSN